MFRMKGFSKPTTLLLALCFSLVICANSVSAGDASSINKSSESEEGSNVVATEEGDRIDDDYDDIPAEALAAEGDSDVCTYDPYRKADTDSPDCTPDMTATHPEGDLGTAMGKCSVPGSMWRKVCQAADAVNEHYSKITSSIDPKAKERAVVLQQSTSIHEECQESQHGILTAECRTCTVRLNPNKFGVSLTCYECQRGASDKSCHHVIRTSPKFIVSAAYFELQDLTSELGNQTDI